MVLFVLPLSALASNHFTNDGFSLVPEVIVNITNPQAVQACDLVTLVDNIVSFATYVAVFIATVMFAYAGFLYVTAASRPENLNQAKGIFGKVFLGLILVLGAWLIINLVMSVLFNDQIGGSWTSLGDCGERREFNPEDYAPVNPGVNTYVPDDLYDPDQRREAELRDWFASCYVGVKDVNSTRVGGTSDAAAVYACDLKRDCEATLGDNTPRDRTQPVDIHDDDSGVCGIVITGGSEGGHAGENRPGSHGAGDKLDFRVTATLRSYIQAQEDAGRFVPVMPPSFGDKQWVDTETDAVWTLEDEDEPNEHYDVCVENCRTPAAHGS